MCFRPGHYYPLIWGNEGLKRGHYDLSSGHYYLLTWKKVIRPGHYYPLTWGNKAL